MMLIKKHILKIVLTIAMLSSSLQSARGQNDSLPGRYLLIIDDFLEQSTKLKDDFTVEGREGPIIEEHMKKKELFIPGNTEKFWRNYINNKVQQAKWNFFIDRFSEIKIPEQPYYLPQNDDDLKLIEENRESLESKEKDTSFSKHFFVVPIKNSMNSSDQISVSQARREVFFNRWGTNDEFISLKQFNLLRMLLDAFTDRSESEKLIKNVRRINDYLPFILETEDKNKGRPYNPNTLFLLLNLDNCYWFPQSSDKNVENILDNNCSNPVFIDCLFPKKSKSINRKDTNELEVDGESGEENNEYISNISEVRELFNEKFKTILKNDDFKKDWINFKISELEFYMNLKPEDALEHEVDSSVLKRVYERVKLHEFFGDVTGKEGYEKLNETLLRFELFFTYQEFLDKITSNQDKIQTWEEDRSMKYKVKIKKELEKIEDEMVKLKRIYEKYKNHAIDHDNLVSQWNAEFPEKTQKIDFVFELAKLRKQLENLSLKKTNVKSKQNDIPYLTPCSKMTNKKFEELFSLENLKKIDSKRENSSEKIVI